MGRCLWPLEKCADVHTHKCVARHVHWAMSARIQQMLSTGILTDWCRRLFSVPVFFRYTEPKVCIIYGQLRTAQKCALVFDAYGQHGGYNETHSVGKQAKQFNQRHVQSCILAKQTIPENIPSRRSRHSIYLKCIFGLLLEAPCSAFCLCCSSKMMCYSIQRPRQICRKSARNMRIEDGKQHARRVLM